MSISGTLLPSSVIRVHPLLPTHRHWHTSVVQKFSIAHPNRPHHIHSFPTASNPTMAPLEYYRVHDNSSATHFNKENGFFAGDTQLQLRMFSRNPSEYRNLFSALDRHLDWSDRTPSPFISVYSDYDTAVNSAIARVHQGKRRVFIAHIDVEGFEGLWYRHAPKLAREIGLRIQPPALRNSEHEFIFFHDIPVEAMTGYDYFK